MQWVLGTLSMGINQSGHEAHYSSPPTPEGLNAWNLYIFIPGCLSIETTLSLSYLQDCRVKGMLTSPMENLCPSVVQTLMPQ